MLSLISLTRYGVDLHQLYGTSLITSNISYSWRRGTVLLATTATISPACSCTLSVFGITRFHLSHQGKPQDLAVRSVQTHPSGISMLFRFLRAEEKSNGVLLYARLMKFTTWLSVVLLAGGVIGSGSYICTRVDIFTPIFAFLLLGSFIFGAILWEVMSERMHSLMIEPYVRSLRAEVESLVVKLGVKLESLVHWSTYRDTVIFSTYRYGHSYHLPKWTARGLQVARIFGATGGKGGATAQGHPRGGKVDAPVSTRSHVWWKEPGQGVICIHFLL